MEIDTYVYIQRERERQRIYVFTGLVQDYTDYTIISMGH